MQSDASARTGGAARVICEVAERCGGCPLITLDYGAQLELKLRRFERTWAARELPSLAPSLVASQRTTQYRNRLRLCIDERGRVDLFNRNKARDCAVVEPSVLDAVEVLGRAALEHLGALAGLHHAEVRARDANGQGAIALHAREPTLVQRSPALATVCTELETAGYLVATAGRGSGHELPRQTWLVHDDVFLLVPVDAFMQVNWPTNRALVAHVVEGLSQRTGREFADLYMGAGNFALPLLARGFRGAGVEAHAGAARAAEQAARQQGLEFDAVGTGDCLEWARSWLSAGRSFDAVIVDPPRAGLKEGADAVAALARHTLVVCSCNPTSLALDVARLRHSGFYVSSLTLFDMFPHTEHIEAVVWLDRK